MKKTIGVVYLKIKSIENDCAGKYISQEVRVYGERSEDWLQSSRHY
jgi:hypothetical protein